MKSVSETLSHRWQDVVNLIVGVWLILAPWALGFTQDSMAAWNAWILGAIVAVAAAAALLAFHEWEEWVSALLGLWLIVSPWILGFSPVAAATWNAVVAGVVIGGLAVWAIYDARRQPATAR